MCLRSLCGSVWRQCDIENTNKKRSHFVIVLAVCDMFALTLHTALTTCFECVCVTQHFKYDTASILSMAAEPPERVCECVYGSLYVFCPR